MLNITLNTDDNYLQHCMAMLCSLFENNKKNSITIHVLKKNLSSSSEKQIVDLTHKYDNYVKFYDVDESSLVGVQFRKNRPLSMAAYYRLLLSSILPQNIDKVLYLDCDMIVLTDVSELFKIELDEYGLAATLDEFPYDNQHRLQLHLPCDAKTFCSGIMLVNLKYWREHNIEPKLLEYAKRQRQVVYLHDQDVLNYAFKNKWFLLPPKWNRGATNYNCFAPHLYKKFDIYEYIKKPAVIHYAAPWLKPWYDVKYPYTNLYRHYLKKSGYETPIFVKVPISKRILVLKLRATLFIKNFVKKISLR